MSVNNENEVPGPSWGTKSVRGECDACGRRQTGITHLSQADWAKQRRRWNYEKKRSESRRLPGILVTNVQPIINCELEAPGYLDTQGGYSSPTFASDSEEENDEAVEWETSSNSFDLKIEIVRSTI